MRFEACGDLVRVVVDKITVSGQASQRAKAKTFGVGVAEYLVAETGLSFVAPRQILD